VFRDREGDQHISTRKEVNMMKKVAFGIESLEERIAPWPLGLDALFGGANNGGCDATNGSQSNGNGSTGTHSNGSNSDAS